jgi:hypothetical protein
VFVGGSFFAALGKQSPRRGLLGEGLLARVTLIASNRPWVSFGPDGIGVAKPLNFDPQVGPNPEKAKPSPEGDCIRRWAGLPFRPRCCCGRLKNREPSFCVTYYLSRDGEFISVAVIVIFREIGEPSYHPRFDGVDANVPIRDSRFSVRAARVRPEATGLADQRSAVLPRFINRFAHCRRKFHFEYRPPDQATHLRAQLHAFEKDKRPPCVPS